MSRKSARAHQPPRPWWQLTGIKVDKENDDDFSPAPANRDTRKEEQAPAKKTAPTAAAAPKPSADGKGGIGKAKAKDKAKEKPKKNGAGKGKGNGNGNGNGKITAAPAAAAKPKRKAPATSPSPPASSGKVAAAALAATAASIPVPATAAVAPTAAPIPAAFPTAAPNVPITKKARMTVEPEVSDASTATSVAAPAVSALPPPARRMTPIRNSARANIIATSMAAAPSPARYSTGSFLQEMKALMAQTIERMEAAPSSAPSAPDCIQAKYDALLELRETQPERDLAAAVKTIARLQTEISAIRAGGAAAVPAVAVAASSAGGAAAPAASISSGDASLVDVYRRMTGIRMSAVDAEKLAEEGDELPAGSIAVLCTHIYKPTQSAVRCVTLSCVVSLGHCVVLCVSGGWVSPAQTRRCCHQPGDGRPPDWLFFILLFEFGVCLLCRRAPPLSLDLCSHCCCGEQPKGIAWRASGARAPRTPRP